MGTTEDFAKLEATLSDKLRGLLRDAQDEKWPFVPEEWQYGDFEEGVNIKDLLDAQNEEMNMAEKDVLLKCLKCAIKEGRYHQATAVAFLVDRYMYWSDKGEELQNMIKVIQDRCADVRISPQIMIRNARLMKDQSAVQVADELLKYLIENFEDLWDFKSPSQLGVCLATCVQIRGQIHHNLGLPVDAATFLVESLDRYWALEPEPDRKGISSSLGILAEILSNISVNDFTRLSETCNFRNAAHPLLEAAAACYEAAFLGRFESLFTVRHHRRGAEALLSYLAQLDEKDRNREQVFTDAIYAIKLSLQSFGTDINDLASKEQAYEYIATMFQFFLAHSMGGNQKLAGHARKVSYLLYDEYCLPGSIRMNDESIENLNAELRELGLPEFQRDADKNREKPRIEKSTYIYPSLKDSKQIETADKLSSDHDAILIGELRLPATKVSLPKIKFPTVSTTHTDTALKSHESKESPYAFSEDTSLSSGSRNSKSRGTTSSGSSFSTASLESVTETASKIQKSKDSSNFSSTDSSTSSSKSKDAISSGSASSGSRFSSGSLVSEPINPSAMTAVRPDGTVNPKGDTAIRSEYGYHRRGSQDEALVSMIRGASGLPYENGASSHESENSRGPSEEIAPNAAGEDIINDNPHPNVDVEQADEEKHVKVEAGKEIDDRIDIAINATADKNTSEHQEKVNAEKPIKAQDSCDSSNRVVTDDVEGSDVAAFQENRSDTTDSEKARQNGVEEKGRDSFREEEERPIDSRSTDESKMTDAAIQEPWMKLVQSLQRGPVDASPDPLKMKIVPFKTYRARLFKYDVVGNKWSYQDTLVYMEKPLAVVKKGNHRIPIKMKFLAQDEPKAQYIAKRYKRQVPLAWYFEDVRIQMISRYYVAVFNDRLKNIGSGTDYIQIVPAYHMQIISDDGNDTLDYLNVEPYIYGNFVKLTNNFDIVNNKVPTDAATAFSHFTYQESGEKIIVEDLQGWVLPERKTTIILTDPAINSATKKPFSLVDMREEGIKAFWEKQHPKCNEVCKALGLERPKKYQENRG